MSNKVTCPDCDGDGEVKWKYLYRSDGSPINWDELSENQMRAYSSFDTCGYCCGKGKIDE